MASSGVERVAEYFILWYSEGGGRGGRHSFGLLQIDEPFGILSQGPCGEISPRITFF